MGSPFTAKVCRVCLANLAPTTQLGQTIDQWPDDPSANALALRLCGGLHALALNQKQAELSALYQAGNSEHPEFEAILVNAMHAFEPFLLHWLKQPPQTNEVGRAAALLPGLLAISRETGLPISLNEVGSSAGLNLCLDHFYYNFGDGHDWGDPYAKVHLYPHMRSDPPWLKGTLNIASRQGCDIAPVNLEDAQSRLRLNAYVWPDANESQIQRRKRLNGAMEIARTLRPSLCQMDAAKFVELQLKSRPEGQAFVLMHSVVWQYLPIQTQKTIEALLEQFGRHCTDRDPIYWLRLEGLGGGEPNARLLLKRWPANTTQKLAQSCFHASWLNFTSC